MNYIEKKLTNGVRVIMVPIKSAKTVTVAIFAGVGANYEKKQENGLSHLLEHMCFKGTKKYPTAKDIAQVFDRIGAYNNASTSREYTGYYAKAQAKQFEVIFDAVADMYQHPIFPEKELAKEKGVIIEEINMYNDDPQSVVADMFTDLLYGDQPAGWDVLGTKKTVRGVTPRTLRAFHDAHYTPENTVIAISGKIDTKKVMTSARTYFGSMKAKKKRVHKAKKIKEQQKAPAVRVRHKNLDQTHLILGLRACAVTHADSDALTLLTTILGRGMSSRLWMKLREEMGLCYYVGASPTLLSTYGYLSLSAGVTHRYVYDVVTIMRDELFRFRDELVESSELQKAKDMLLGNMFLSLESPSALAFGYGRMAATGVPLETPEEDARKLKAVAAHDIQRVARKYIVEKHLNCAVIGPHKNTRAFSKLLSA